MATLPASLDPRRSVRARIALSFGGAALFFAVGGGLYQGHREEEVLRSQIGGSFRQLAFLLGADLARNIGDRHQDLRFAASLPIFRSAESEPQRRERRASLAELQRSHPEFAWVGFANATGRVDAATTGALEGVDVSERPWFSRGMAGSYFGDFHDAVLLQTLLAPPPAEPLRLMDIAVPVRDASGRSRGVIGAHLDVSWAKHRMAALKRGIVDDTAIEVLLLGRDGQVLAGPTGSVGRSLKVAASPAGPETAGFAVEAMEGGERFLHGSRLVPGHGEFPGFGWTVVVRQRAELAFAPADRARNTSLVFAVTLGLVFAALGWWIAGRIARPLERITAAAARLRAGDAAELPQRLPPDEVGTLAATLRLLVAGMKHDEALIRERESEQANILETMAEGVAIFDREGRITMINAASERILGAPRSTVVGRHYADVPWRRVQPDGREYPLRSHPFVQARAGAERIEGTEFSIVTADGRSTSIVLNAAAIRDQKGGFGGIVATYADVSERRRSEEALRRSEQLKSAVISSALDAVVTVDHRGAIVEFNPAAELCFGYQRDRVIGKSMAEVLIPDELRARHREGFERCVATGESRILGNRLEMPALRADGSRIDIELAIIRIPDEQPPIFTAFIRDITERKRAESLARRAQERLDRALDASKVALFEIEVRTGFVYLSESWSLMRGGAAVPTETNVTELVEITHPEDREGVWSVAMAAVHGERDSYEVEHRVRTLGGEWIWIISRSRIVERDAEGRALRMAGTNVDITERKHAEQRIHYLNTRDALTDLSNRALFADRLEEAVGAAGGQSRRLALIAVGLDRFTSINDSLGHDCGDEVLKAVANRIAASVAADDVVARPGGDEFLVMLTGIDSPAAASRAAEGIRAAVASPISVAGHKPVVTTSIGIAMFPEDGETAGVLLRNAETALHFAKDSGRNCVHFFTAHMNAAARVRFETESELRRGLERDEFLLHFQPLIDLASGAITGWEALVRWQHPERGLLSPALFLPTAEETGLIVPLGEYLMLKACRQAMAWKRAGLKAGRIAVNVSVQQFRHAGFLKSIRAALAATGLDPRLLEIEIVENALIGHGPDLDATLKTLGTWGIELAIDDFGTGYSSLSYLKRLPIDTVKIDQSFVQDVPSSPEACAIVHAVIAMAHSLGLKVTAEGVETSAQLEFLRQSGCNFGQGYLFGRPEPPEYWTRHAADNVLPLKRPQAAP